MDAQSPRQNDKQTSEPKEKVLEEKTFSTPQHEINKTAVIIGVVGIVALLFMESRDEFS